MKTSSKMIILIQLLILSSAVQGQMFEAISSWWGPLSDTADQETSESVVQPSYQAAPQSYNSNPGEYTADTDWYSAPLSSSGKQELSSFESNTKTASNTPYSLSYSLPEYQYVKQQDGSYLRVKSANQVSSVEKHVEIPYSSKIKNKYSFSNTKNNSHQADIPGPLSTHAFVTHNSNHHVIEPLKQASHASFSDTAGNSYSKTSASKPYSTGKFKPANSEKTVYDQNVVSTYIKTHNPDQSNLNSNHQNQNNFASTPGISYGDWTTESPLKSPFNPLFIRVGKIPVNAYSTKSPSMLTTLSQISKISTTTSKSLHTYITHKPSKNSVKNSHVFNDLAIYLTTPVPRGPTTVKSSSKYNSETTLSPRFSTIGISMPNYHTLTTPATTTHSTKPPQAQNIGESNSSDSIIFGAWTTASTHPTSKPTTSLTTPQPLSSSMSTSPSSTTYRTPTTKSSIATTARLPQSSIHTSKKPTATSVITTSTSDLIEDKDSSTEKHPLLEIMTGPSLFDSFTIPPIPQKFKDYINKKVHADTEVDQIQKQTQHEKNKKVMVNVHTIQGLNKQHFLLTKPASDSNKNKEHSSLFLQQELPDIKQEYEGPMYNHTVTKQPKPPSSSPSLFDLVLPTQGTKKHKITTQATTTATVYQEKGDKVQDIDISLFDTEPLAFPALPVPDLDPLMSSPVPEAEQDSSLYNIESHIHNPVLSKGQSPVPAQSISESQTSDLSHTLSEPQNHVPAQLLSESHITAHLLSESQVPDHIQSESQVPAHLLTESQFASHLLSEAPLPVQALSESQVIAYVPTLMGTHSPIHAQTQLPERLLSDAPTQLPAQSSTNIPVPAHLKSEIDTHGLAPIVFESQPPIPYPFSVESEIPPQVLSGPQENVLEYLPSGSPDLVPAHILSPNNAAYVTTRPYSRFPQGPQDNFYQRHVITIPPRSYPRPEFLYNPLGFVGYGKEIPEDFALPEEFFKSEEAATKSSHSLHDTEAESVTTNNKRHVITIPPRTFPRPAFLYQGLGKKGTIPEEETDLIAETTESTIETSYTFLPTKQTSTKSPAGITTISTSTTTTTTTSSISTEGMTNTENFTSTTTIPTEASEPVYKITPTTTERPGQIEKVSSRWGLTRPRVRVNQPRGLMKERPRSSLTEQKPESTTISAFDYFNNNKYVLLRNPIDRSDRFVEDDSDEVNNDKTIEEILESSNKYDRSLFKRKNKPNSPIYIRKDTGETKPSNAHRYGNLFGDAERRRQMFEKKKKSLSLATIKANINNAKETALTMEHKEANENTTKEQKLPFKTGHIFNSDKGLIEQIKDDTVTVTDVKDETATPIMETEKDASITKTIGIEIREDFSTENILIRQQLEKGSEEKENVHSPTKTRMKSTKNNSLFMKPPTKNNSLFLKSPLKHFITRPLLRFPIYPSRLPEPVPYNQNYPHPSEFARLPGFLDYDYDYGPMNSVQLTDGLDIIPMVPVIDGYAKVNWIR